MRSLAGFSEKGWNITAALATLVLVVYMGFLIMANYLSQVELQEGVLGQLKQDAEKRAIALTYFFSERTNDLKELARNRAISAYFENKALGMSMLYGLRASLDTIAGAFDRLLEDKTLGGDRIYSRIAFIQENGEVLVGTTPKSSIIPTNRDWSKLLAHERLDTRILVESSGESAEILVSSPYFFKGEYLGQIIALISPRTIYKNLVRQSNPSPLRFAYVVTDEGKLVLPTEIPPDIEYSELPDLNALGTEKIQGLALPTRNGRQEKVLVSHLPLPNTPCAFASIFPSSEVYGGTPPWQLLLALALLSLFVLGSMAAAWRINARNLTLRISLDQEAKSRREIEEKNQQLIREIGERKRVEEALRESEERYRRFFEEDLSGAFIATPAGRILACNPAFLKIFGFFSVEEASKTDFFSLCHDPKHREVFLSLLKKSKVLEHYVAEYRRLDGQIIHTIENVIGSFDEKGELIEIKGFVIDNTDRKRLEKQLRLSQKMEAIGTLAGGIAHDFNNILTAVLGNAEMGLTKLAEEHRAEHNLKEILKAGKRARDLVKQIVAFSRQENLEPRPFQLIPIVKEVLKLLRVSLPLTIEIRKNISPFAGIVVADPIQIHQLLMNLLTNAGHAMEKTGGVLEVNLINVEVETPSVFHDFDMQPGPYVELSISDTGSGMDQTTIERIFDPFFSTKPFGKGSGMGLAVVHGIVKGLDGAIKVESELGRGSTFRVFLPRIADAVNHESDAVESLPRVNRTPRILLVDDDETLLKMGELMLERFGYRVTGMNSGFEALESFRKQPYEFDLVVADQRMPNMTGLDLARALVNIRREIPIILCTGYGDEIDHERMKEIGVRSLVKKPVTFTELADTARKVLEQKPNNRS